MSWSMTLFRVAGIPVKVHLTFVLILIWAAAVWAIAPGASEVDAFIGVIAVLALFGCVVLHELAHSLVALRFGARVRDILLLPIGGVSRIEAMPGRAGQELLVALVGPLVSLALAFVWLVVAAVVAPRTLTLSVALLYPPVGNRWLALPAYLAMANLILGVFNLLPAFPMDGGRVLRALLAMRLGRRQGTAIAVTIGQGMALLLGVAGFWSGNLILILLAIFIWLGAGSEGAQDALREALDDIVVGQAMICRPLTLNATDSLSRAVNLTLSSAQADFPVVAAGNSSHLVGLLTRSDLIRGLREGGSRMVGEVMRPPILTAAPSDSLFAVQQRMQAKGQGAIPVVQGGDLVGLVTSSDIGEAYQILLANDGARPIAS
ncbi:MAG TPA: site-2 protease family protein [Chloroflexota bacterium]|nr:site-2 protease family protein [Chloroflexota bacterium]